jgi:tetratricopeptide (TPR) repeat protein/transcriptional regulator with XRE-family HTH domain
MFGEAVRQHRRRLGITQEELVDRTGLSIRGLRKIEAGKVITPRWVTIRLLADAFGLTGEARERFCELADPALPPPAQACGPAQLPLDAAGFAGREGYLSQLFALFAGASGQPTAVPVIVLHGMAGVGKTTLAVHWAHQVRDQFPDGQIFINLRGFDPTGLRVNQASALRGFLEALDIPASRLPSGVDAMAALYRSLLADRRMLIVLDNVRDVEHIRALLPGSPGCLALVTSRAQLTGLATCAGAHMIAVDLLTMPEARQLLALRLGQARLEADPAAVDEIVARCARLPLALAITAAHAAARPRAPLATFATELHDQLAALSDSDVNSDVRTVLSWSYHALTAPAARLFRLLSLHPGPDFTSPAAASLAGWTQQYTMIYLTELTRAHLITETSANRYGFHDLLRAYADEQARDDAPDDRQDARRRMLSHYVHTACAAALLLNPQRTAIDLSSDPETHTCDFINHRQAQNWFTAEKTVLIRLIDCASQSGCEEHAWQLAWAISDFLYRLGHWQEWAATQRAAVHATEQINNRAQQARALRHLGRAYSVLGDHAEAEANYRQALAILRTLDHKSAEANAHLDLASLRDQQCDYRSGLDHAKQAMILFTAANDHDGSARALNTIGWFHSKLGNHHEALSHCEQALTQLRKLGDRMGQAYTWDSLGCAHYQLGHHQQAITCFQESVALSRDMGDRRIEATNLLHLSDAYLAIDNQNAARQRWQEAKVILVQLKHPDIDNAIASIRLSPPN